MKQKLIVAFFLNIIFTALSAQSCGVERWNIKTLSDSDTVRIDFNNIVFSSVKEQVAIPHPMGKKRKRLDSEINVYSLDCFIVGYKREDDDKDIHIVIRDIKTDSTMVAEILSPLCPEVINTSRYSTYKDVEDWFTKNIGNASSKFYKLDSLVTVKITGVGFFDHLHGQTGMARNGREIHPVLSMSLLNN